MSSSDTASIFSRSLPLMIRAMSSRSSTSRICDIALRSMTSSAWARDSTDGCVCRIRVQPMTAFSGVRISCDSVARNSSFSRDASSAMLPRLLGRRDLVAQLALGDDPLGDVFDQRDRADHAPSSVSGSMRADCAISVSPAP